MAAGLVVWAALAVAASVTTAGESDRIQSDRPDVSTSTYTVPPGALQVESGVQYSRTSIGGSPADREFSLEVLLRAGLTERLELRLLAEPLVVTRGAPDDTGNGGISVEAKYRFLDAREGRWWPSLGVLPVVSFPIAHRPHRTNVPDFALIGLAGFSLPWALGLDVNAGVGGNGQRPGGYLVQGVAAATVSRDIGERWATYAEIFFASAAERGARSSVGFDAGVQFFVTQRLVLDAAAETSLAGPGPDYAFRAGLSVRFGK